MSTIAGSMVPLLAIWVLVAACGSEGADGQRPVVLAEAVAAPPAVVDRVMPIGAALDEFRDDLAPVDRLQGGAASAEALLAEIVTSLAASDTAGLVRLTLDRAEFGYLYYASTPLAQPPYELPPSLAWFRMEQESRTGMLRALREMGGREMTDAELRCVQSPVQQEANRVHAGCLVRVGDREMRLFGSLLEREGRFKVLSWANDF